jgi:hypothetical protein
VILFSVLADVRTMLMVEHPFAARPLEAGTTVERDDVVLVDVPAGLLPPVVLPLRLVRPVAAGEPLTPSLAASPATLTPAGWVSISLEVPEPVEAGDELLLIGTTVAAGPDLAVEALVVSLQPSDGFASTTALVAIPREAAAGVARAHLEGRLTVLWAADRD